MKPLGLLLSNVLEKDAAPSLEAGQEPQSKGAVGEHVLQLNKTTKIKFCF